MSIARARGFFPLIKFLKYGFMNCVESSLLVETMDILSNSQPADDISDAKWTPVFVVG